jgi:hypothetical protein
MKARRWHKEVDGVPVAVEDSDYRELLHNERTVAKDTVGDSDISTVFLGLDHGWGDGPPVLYETMVFGGAMSDEQVRYCTRQEAIAGHAAMIKRVKAAQAEQ